MGQRDAHILIVEGDPFMAKVLAFLLAESGYASTTLADARRVGEVLAENTIDLVLLDALLPRVDGLPGCAGLRRAHPDLPVILLSARAALADLVAGFGHGADDFVATPFEPTELLARIGAVLHRYRRAERTPSGAVIRAGKATLDLVRLQFAAPGRPPVLLTPTEMKILACLMRNANAVVARRTLVERVWDYEYAGKTNRLDVYIGRLRAKIEADRDEPAYIDTVRGFGYRFRAAG